MMKTIDVEPSKKFWTRWLKANKKSELACYEILMEIFEADENGFIKNQTITSLQDYLEDLTKTIEERIHKALLEGDD
jgi:hypothetical protein